MSEQDEREELNDDIAAEEAVEGVEAAAEDAPEDLQARIDELKSTVAYAMAEVDNTRKRAQREVADARTYGVQKLAADLIPVVDNFERAIEALTPEMRAGMADAGKQLLTGVEMTQKELISALSRHGITAVAVQPGDKFDPNLHQATAQIPSEHPSGAVAGVMQTGWKIGERTLRAAMVAVSSGEPVAAAPEPSEPPAAAGPGATVDTKA